jgi:CubicO group peptidase (beta-lactamase class C family)
VKTAILKSAIVAMTLLMAHIAYGQAAPDEKEREARVDKLFERWDKPDSPGCALAVVKDGSILHKRGYGSANLEYGIPNTPSTIFHVASVSKQFTAMAVTLLAHEGKLSLDDDVRKYLPEVPDFGKVITLRHLIHHTSGLRDQWNLLVLAGWRMEDVITEQDILELVKRQKALNFEPGKEFLYCNTGYTLLGLVVQRVTGQSLREFTQARIFGPLGMTNTHFHDDHRMIVKNRAYSYEPKRGGGYENSPLEFANVGATSLFTTVEDLALWDQNFYDGRIGGSAVLADMLTKGKLNDGKELDYASALVIGDYKGLRMVEHGGADAGYRADLLRFPDQHFSVIVLANLATFSPDTLARRVADIYLADELKSPSRPAPPADPRIDPQLYDAYVGDYELRPGVILSVVKEEDRLMVQPDDRRKYRLYPASQAEFVVRPVDVRFSFVRNGSGKATRMILHQSGGDLSARRVDRAARAPAPLDDYLGEYYSDELGAIYTVAQRKGQLVLRHRKGEETLRPAIADLFTSNMGIVTFTRGRRQRIDGLLIDTGRVRRLRFTREKPRGRS